MRENGRATAAYIGCLPISRNGGAAASKHRVSRLHSGFGTRREKTRADQPDKRPDFQRLLKAVQAGLLDKIVVDRQDRFGVADAYQWGKFISLLREHGTALVDADGKVLSGDDDVSILTGTLGAITSTANRKRKPTGTSRARSDTLPRGNTKGATRRMVATWFALIPPAREVANGVRRAFQTVESLSRREAGAVRREGQRACEKTLPIRSHSAVNRNRARQVGSPGI